ncbi:DUF7573 domain-containing protein [Halostagnicola larsenii]|uniref:DUF7573 domain-containing protein n=1 Tax=Halostagnicola larsenii TaxID=353800 RepID=UPI000A04BE8F|nr:hypothetical protein [Halostagnicola larsenii]
MTEDATLSAFAADDDAADANADEGASETDASADATGTDPVEPGGTNTDIEPATSTYVWGTYTCDACSETVDRAWLEDGAFVCPACKDW